MKIKKLAFFAILVISLFAGCEKKDKISQDVVVDNHQQKASKQKKEAEPLIFNLKTSTGKTIKITAKDNGSWNFEGLEGKAVLLDFFGTWCPPCKAGIPHLNKIRDKYKDRFEIIGIDLGTRAGTDTPKEELAKFIKEFDIKYPVITGVAGNQLFSGLKHLNTNGSIPFMLLFSRKGQYIERFIGLVPEEMLTNYINRAAYK